MIMIHLKFENMKNRLLILLVILSLTTFGQVTLDSARNYVNSNIVTNGTKAITGAKVNTSLNNIITAVGLQRKVDSLYYNGSADSLVYKINTKRYALPVGSGGALSSITAATSSNIINNGNLQQEWQWDSLTSGSGLVLSSSSIGASSNTQAVFRVNQTGANTTSAQTTYGAIFSNTKTGTTSTNIAGRFVASGGTTNNFAIEAENQVKILNASTGARYLSFFSGTTENGRIGNLNAFGALTSDNLDIANNCGMSIVFRTGASGNGTERMRIRPSGSVVIGSTGGDAAALEITGGIFPYAIYVTDGKSIFVNGAAGGTYKTGLNTNFGADGSDNMFFQVAGGTKMIIANANGVSIGANTTPAVSAILDVVSTTKGFAPPEMTATQASAITTTTRKLIIYVTSTNGTFTSAGLWMWNGTTWKLISAE